MNSWSVCQIHLKASGGSAIIRGDLKDVMVKTKARVDLEPEQEESLQLCDPARSSICHAWD